MSGAARVLIVDDEPLLRDLAENILKADGFDVITAANGFECLDQHRSHGENIALTVMDFHMPPGPSGEEVFESLIKINPTAKVLLASGTADAEVIRQMVDRGLCDALPKPYRSAELLKAVRQAIDSCDPVRVRREKAEQNR